MWEKVITSLSVATKKWKDFHSCLCCPLPANKNGSRYKSLSFGFQLVSMSTVKSARQIKWTEQPELFWLSWSWATFLETLSSIRDHQESWIVWGTESRLEILDSPTPYCSTCQAPHCLRIPKPGTRPHFHLSRPFFNTHPKTHVIIYRLLVYTRTDCSVAGTLPQVWRRTDTELHWDSVPAMRRPWHDSLL